MTALESVLNASIQMKTTGSQKRHIHSDSTTIKFVNMWNYIDLHFR